MRVALFDLLAGDTEGYFDARDPLRIVESIRLELERLLNTRRTERAHGFAPTIIDYGMSDWSTLYADREEDHRILIRDIRSAIIRFEPRLALEDVDVQALPGQRTRMTVRVMGHVRGLEAAPNMSFVLELGESGFEVRHE
ncbi:MULTISPECIES: type VI secretion system baseplate subunit TssE [Pseudomonas]|jgi:type VI secretion system lysozyme-related protein|uniref:Type VI secretion system baseplate subunit TssE n=1 Tax=Pseudomonas gingeri TaxID=117681 RepID=A0A7Y8BNR7_9PSED|nr:MULTISPECIES: type VI secretion system baseplate subunit TssE [Pseudomonas]MCU1742041.1 type VI secretion system baseplate subunit TssE [Pseudomonas sp. 20S_6.2_Bac1]NWB50412.1 type VI secretion system baseplate subunit TssE [Pseudomonas gingeri]